MKPLLPPSSLATMIEPKARRRENESAAAYDPNDNLHVIDTSSSLRRFQPIRNEGNEGRGDGVTRPWMY